MRNLLARQTLFRDQRDRLDLEVACIRFPGWHGFTSSFQL